MNQSGLISFSNTLSILALLVSGTLLGSGTLSAQDKSASKKKAKSAPVAKPGKGPAYVSPPADDANFPLMGEFVGQINKGEDQQKVAIQIRPVAGNRFVALAFYGGLPGQPQHQSEEMNLIGLRGEDSLILSGGPWAIFVDPQGCTLVSKQGKKVGRLKRVKRVSPTLGAKAPEGATIIFDGKNTENLLGAEVTPNGLLKQGVTVLPMFQDFNLHIEFRLPYMPLAEGQSRGNSGLYLQSRYECQILDSFGTEKMFNGLGALYRQKSPDINMAFPPLTWQTYDVEFTAPRWSANGEKIRDAHISSWINGVKVQDNVALPNKTGAGKEEEPVLLPTHFQDHGDPVRYRNAWIVDRGLMHVDFPVMATKAQQKEASAVGWEDQKEEEEAKEEETKVKESKVEESKSGETKAEESKSEEAGADQSSEGQPDKPQAKEMKSEKAAEDKPAEDNAKPEEDKAEENEGSAKKADAKVESVEPKKGDQN